MVLSRPGRWRWWDWCTPQPHNAPPNPSLSGMWGSSLRVMGLARLIIIGRLLLLTLVVLSNPEQPTTLFMLCVHPPRLSWKKDQNTNLCILSNIYVVLRFWECAFLLCGFHRSLFRNISSQFGRLLLVSHFLWTSSDPTSLEMSRSIQQKLSWKQCAKLVLLNPHTTPPTNALTPGWWLCR